MTDNLLESSDSVRQAKPLRHAKTVTFDEPFPLELGGSLPSVTVVYETYGQLNEARDNAVLICHAISGDSHVARHDEKDDPGWWDIAIGPGKPIDTDRCFVICPNQLGGCRGTTGPGSANPATGKPYGGDFPTITIGDMVEVQRRLVDHLGIEKLLAVVGGSMGGHQALAWATRYPQRVAGVIALATSARLTSQALAFDVVGRNAIRRDPHYHGGQYYGEESGPEVGLAIARMIAHITYLSQEAMTQKFEADRLQPRNIATEFEKTFSVGSYLGHQGDKFVERFDANSYVALSTAMDRFDLGGTPAELADSFRPTRSRWLVISFSSDWLFPPDQSRDIVKALIANNAAVSYCNVESNCGHDGFLLPNELDCYGGLMRAFLANIGDRRPGTGDRETPATVHGSRSTVHDSQSPTNIFQRHRLDYERIVELIPASASVLDLGCGSGSLLARLRERDHPQVDAGHDPRSTVHGPRLVGVELDERKVLAGVQRGLDVIHADLNKGLGTFGDGQFDCVVLSRTLPAVRDVPGVISEMLRVGRIGIVSFPNLAYHKLRRILAEEGRAPRGYGWMREPWYDTADVRFLAIADFEEFCREQSVRIHRRIALNTEEGNEVFDDPNRNADIAIFVVSRNDAR